MTTKQISRGRILALNLAATALLLDLGATVRAQEVFSAKMVQVGKIEIEISAPFEPYNSSVDGPIIHVFEIVKAGPGAKKTFERAPLAVSRSKVSNHFIATIELQPPTNGFDHYEVEVRNYKTPTEPETFRGGVHGITAEITGASGKNLELTFRGLNTTDWAKLRAWISASAASGPAVTVTLENGQTQKLNVTKASHIEFAPFCFPLKIGERFTDCSLIADLALDVNLPVGQPGKVRLTFPTSVFAPNPVAEALPLELIRNGVGAGQVDTAPLPASQDRTPLRTDVLEVGGSYNTSIKLDPDPATNERPKRETKGALDLRMAATTITFADKTSGWSIWTPVELDAQISNGKLTGESLSTNTMRLFTGLQRVYSARRKQGLDFFRFVAEGGATADRDLRVIEYTGSGDFRYNPVPLNRILEVEPPPDLGKRIKVVLTPLGFELGRRQVRRDPIFLADNFVRRFRFAAKLEVEIPPYFQFGVENRSWWRGEVDENRFKNHFETSFTFIPLSLSPNSSAGVVMSYERGALPPFTTPRVSALKIGFRIRRKEW